MDPNPGQGGCRLAMLGEGHHIRADLLLDGSLAQLERLDQRMERSAQDDVFLSANQIDADAIAIGDQFGDVCDPNFTFIHPSPPRGNLTQVNDRMVTGDGL